MSDNVGKAAELVRAALKLLEIDTEQPGRRETPERWVKALREMTAGLREEPPELLPLFESHCGMNDIVTVKGIRFNSLCEHHLLPFSGEVDVTYVPTSYVVGLSKIPRTVLHYAKQPQLQEKLGHQIAHRLYHGIKGAQHVQVEIRAVHQCMTCRGVETDAVTHTTTRLGRLHAL